MPEDPNEPILAQQSEPQPTHKVRVATNVAGGVAGVIASVVAGYGNEALRDVIFEILPGMAQKPNATNFIITLLVGGLMWLGTTKAGRVAAYDVLDAPNTPIETIPKPAPRALQVKQRR